MPLWLIVDTFGGVEVETAEQEYNALKQLAEVFFSIFISLWYFILQINRNDPYLFKWDVK